MQSVALQIASPRNSFTNFCLHTLIRNNFVFAKHFVYYTDNEFKSACLAPRARQRVNVHKRNRILFFSSSSSCTRREVQSERYCERVCLCVWVFAFVVHGQCIQGHWIVRMRRLDRHNYVSSAQWFISLAELYLSFLTDHFSLKICDRIRRVLRVEAVRKIDISHTCVGWFVCLFVSLFVSYAKSSVNTAMVMILALDKWRI